MTLNTVLIDLRLAEIVLQYPSVAKI